MADKKITQLTNITGADLANSDEFVVVDITADETKAITFDELKTAFDTGTGFVRITGDTMTGALNVESTITSDGMIVDGNVTFGDNDKAIFGAGSDLQIYHDGSNSYISEEGTGSLAIRAENLVLQNSDSSKNYGQGINGGAFEINYNGVKKLATTSTGIDVTGTVTSDGLTVDGVGSFTSDVSTDTDILTFVGTSWGDGELLSVPFKRGSNTLGKISVAAAGAGQSGVMRLYTGSGGTSTERIKIESNGDITFFENDGTTASFVYDASAGTTFNEAGSDRDFRVESVSNANMLRVDAGNNRVGVGTSPATVLDVYSTSADADGILRVYQNTATSNPTMQIRQRGEGGSQNTNQGLLIDIAGHNDGGAYILNTSVTNSNINGGIAISPFNVKGIGTFQFRQGGVINENGGDSDFRVESDSSTHALFVNAGNNRIGIGESAPDEPLHLTTNEDADVVKVESTNVGSSHGPNLRLLRNSSCH